MSKRGKKMKRRNKKKYKRKNKISADFPWWTDLPSDLTANILERLGAEEILHNAQFVCKTWRNVCLSYPALWREINFISRDYSVKKHHKMCRCAVDLSQGQLIHLTITNFGNDDLLHYIVDRSSHLRRLKLVFCFKISATAMIEAFKKLHDLEELHLIMSEIHPGDIGTIGDTCPMLKSFTYTSYGKFDKITNELALAISKSMPNLYHLVLIANSLSEEGLQAILDGCPHLESLDLRHCLFVYLGGAIGERCRKQIKHLRLPTDSIADYHETLFPGRSQV